MFLSRDIIYLDETAQISNRGGVCLYLNSSQSSFPCQRLPECNDPNIESLWVHIRPSSLPRSVSSIILCVVYHSIVNSEPENIALCQHTQFNLDTILAKQPNALVIVTGDFIPTTTGLKEKDLIFSKNIDFQIYFFRNKSQGISKEW